MKTTVKETDINKLIDIVDKKANEITKDMDPGLKETVQTAAAQLVSELLEAIFGKEAMIEVAKAAAEKAIKEALTNFFTPEALDSMTFLWNEIDLVDEMEA